MRKFIGLIAFSFAISNLIAQTEITGTIEDGNSGERLLGASIFIAESQQGTYSDDNGTFQLQTDEELPFIVHVSYVGYETQSFTISGDTYLEVKLNPSDYLGETVVVSVSRRKEKVSEAPASISIIDSRKLKASAVSHPAQHLRNVPGLTLSQQGVDNFQIALRGRQNSFYAETYFLQDYRALISPGTGDLDIARTGLSDIDLDRIEVIRGPGSALYGPGVETGVIHFISRSPFDTGTSISITGGTQSSAHIAARYAQKLSEKFAYKFLLRYNRAKDFTLDPTDSTDIASIAAFIPTVTSALDGSILRENVTGIEDQTESYGATATFEYRFNNNASLTSNTGWNYRKGIVRAALGEALSDFADYYTQLRYSSKNFFLQGFVNVLDNDGQKGFLYRTGLSSVTKNTGYQFQTQYLFDELTDNLDVAIGAEAQLTKNRSQGTVNGRYEDNDDFNIYSLYSQANYNLSDKIEIVAAARMDRFTAIAETAISPRFALVYKALPTHNFRFTYNRAVSSPPALDIFADIPFGQAPVFDIQFIGGVDPITFSDPLVTRSFIPGVGDYSGIDMNLILPYSIALGALGPAFSPELNNYLNSLIGNISGVSPGLLIVNGQPATNLPVRGPLRSTKTSSYELGYKGVFGANFAVNLDVYYNRRKDLVFSGEASPLVLYPTLVSDLTATFNAISDEQTLMDLGTSQAAIAAQLEAVAGSLAANPLGLVESSLAAESDRPQFIISRYNLGAIDYYGADLGLSYYLNDDFTIYGNFSWLSKNLWNDEELGASGTGQIFALNVADKKLTLGFDYLPSEKGLGYNASLRYQNAVQIREGTIFTGLLDAYTVVDAGLNYNFGNGTIVSATGQNIFNSTYRVMPKMPKIGSLFLVKLRKDF